MNSELCCNGSKSESPSGNRLSRSTCVTGTYALLALAWILLTDVGLRSMELSPVVQTWKGCLFVSLTCLGLGLLLQQWERGWKRDLQRATEAEQALRESESRLSLALANARIGIWEYDLHNQVLYGSRETHEMLGNTEPFQEMRKSLGSCVHPEDRVEVLMAIHKAVEERRLFTAEYRLMRPDGTHVWVRGVGRGMYDQDGKPHKVVGTAQNITELRLEAEQRRELELQLRHSQKMEAIGQLAGGVAHDFNNLLTVISGNLAFLPVEPGSEAAESVAMIENALDRAASLTRQLLMFSRKAVPRREPLDVARLVENLAGMLRRTLGPQVQLNVHTSPGGVPRVFADAGMLEQVLVNLAVNARDAMPKGGELRLEVTTGAPLGGQPGVEIRVCDTGEGIAPEHLPRIFEPFFTTKEVGKGTGLGLATAYGIVQQHEGEIAVYTELGRGTEFRVRLPAARAEQQADSSRVVTPSGRLCGDGYVLVIEDEPLVALVIENVLKRAGYSPLIASSSEEGMRTFARHANELKFVLTDVGLPGPLTGIDLGVFFQQQRPQLPVLYMSGFTREAPGDIQDRLLNKPFSADQLANALLRVMPRATRT